MWTANAPTEVGLYAVIEPYSNVSGRGIYEVTLHASGDLVYGGFSRVANALPGTLWHKLAALPTPADPSATP